VVDVVQEDISGDVHNKLSQTTDSLIEKKSFNNIADAELELLSLLFAAKG